MEVRNTNLLNMSHNQCRPVRKRKPPNRFSDQTFESGAPYDRSHGGYKWPTVTGDDEYHQPKRDLEEKKQEERIVEQFRAGRQLNRHGYVNDGWLVDDEVEDDEVEDENNSLDYESGIDEETDYDEIYTEEYDKEEKVHGGDDYDEDSDIDEDSDGEEDEEYNPDDDYIQCSSEEDMYEYTDEE